MSSFVEYINSKPEKALIRAGIITSVAIHVIALILLANYGLAKPGRRIVTIKMVQAAKSEAQDLKSSSGGGRPQGGGSGQGAEKPAAPAAKPSTAGATNQVDRTALIRQAVSKKGLLNVLNKRGGQGVSSSGLESAMDRVAGSGGGMGFGHGKGLGDGVGDGTDEWAGTGLDTGGFGSGTGTGFAGEAPRVAKLEKSQETKVESKDAAKTEELSNREALELIKRTVESYLGGLRYTYNKALRKNPDLEGRITVAITITPKGQVTDAKVVETTMNNAEMENEIVAKIKHWNFPPVLPKTMTVTYPFVFFPPT